MIYALVLAESTRVKAHSDEVAASVAAEKAEKAAEKNERAASRLADAQAKLQEASSQAADRLKNEAARALASAEATAKTAAAEFSAASEAAKAVNAIAAKSSKVARADAEAAAAATKDRAAKAEAKAQAAEAAAKSADKATKAAAEAVKSAALEALKVARERATNAEAKAASFYVKALLEQDDLMPVEFDEVAQTRLADVGWNSGRLLYLDSADNAGNNKFPRLLKIQLGGSMAFFYLSEDGQSAAVFKVLKKQASTPSGSEKRGLIIYAVRVNADKFDNLKAHGSYDNAQYFELVNEMVDYCATAGMFTTLKGGVGATNLDFLYVKRIMKHGAVYSGGRLGTRNDSLPDIARLSYFLGTGYKKIKGASDKDWAKQVEDVIGGQSTRFYLYHN